MSLCVVVFETSPAPEVADIQAATLRLPVVDDRFRYAVPASNVATSASFDLPQHADDRLFCKLFTLHQSAFPWAKLSFLLADILRGRSRAAS